MVDCEDLVDAVRDAGPKTRTEVIAASVALRPVEALRS